MKKHGKTLATGRNDGNERGNTMLGAQEQRSEVARLLSQIQTEYEAAHRGLHDLASGVSRHEVITQKMEEMGRLQGELQELVGPKEAVFLVASQLETPPAPEEMGHESL